MQLHSNMYGYAGTTQNTCGTKGTKEPVASRSPRNFCSKAMIEHWAAACVHVHSALGNLQVLISNPGLCVANKGSPEANRGRLEPEGGGECQAV
eukprot:1159561-Pelagomonas_calceolata.AAC.8